MFACFQRQLPLAARNRVANAAALAVVVDIQPLSFCDGHARMRSFAKTIFELGQKVPANELIDPKSYLPGRTAVTTAVKELRDESRQNFIAQMHSGKLRYGGAATIDGVHLNLHGRHYYDFTLHSMHFREKGPFSGVQFEIKTVPLLLVEGPDPPTAKNIRTRLNSALLENYEIPLERFMQGFTMVTDGAAVMARVANASASKDIHKPDETWMSCIAYALNNAMKSVLSTNCQGPVMEVVLQDFRAMKKVIEDSNRTGWSHLLPLVLS